MVIPLVPECQSCALDTYSNLKLQQCLEMCHLSEHDSQQLSGGAEDMRESEVYAASRHDNYVTQQSRPQCIQRNAASTAHEWGR